MIYLLFGKQDLMIKTRLGKLIKERIPEADEFSLVKYNGRQTLVQEIVSDCRTLPLGYERKMVVVEEAYFLVASRTKEKIEKDQNYDVLLEYLHQPNPATDLVFTIAAPGINLKTELGQLLKRDAMIYELTDIDSKSWPEYVRRYFAKYEVTIDQSAIIELVARCQNDATQFVSEAQKLMLYSHHISLDTVKTLVTRPLEENSFALSNALTKGRVDEALTIYRDLKTFNEEPVALISLLARQFRLMLKVHYLAQTGLDQIAISKKLDIHEYRVKLAMASRKTIDEDRLISILEQLYELDYNIKSGQIDRFYGFELFLLNFAA
jgi:DNA polymerase-3 subunit delta